MKTNSWRLVSVAALLSIYAFAWPWALMDWFGLHPVDAFMLACVWGPLAAAGFFVVLAGICVALGGIVLGGAWTAGTCIGRIRRRERDHA